MTKNYGSVEIGLLNFTTTEDTKFSVFGTVFFSFFLEKNKNFSLKDGQRYSKKTYFNKFFYIV